METGRGGRRAIPIRFAPAIASVLLCLAASPLQAQTIHQNADQFSGSTVYNTERREVDLGSPAASRVIDFQFVASKPVPNPDIPYALAVHTQTLDGILIQRGASLLLKLDGTETMPLSGNGSENAREAGANVTESAYYALTPEKLKRIAAAKSVEFRIAGDRQTIIGAWRADLLADAGAFSALGPELLEASAAPVINTPRKPVSSPVPNPVSAKQTHAVLGVGITDVPAQPLGLAKLVPPQGALVVEVTPGSIASKAGIAAGDVILEFGSTPIAKVDALQAAVAKMQPGEHVSIKVWRASPSTLDIQF